MEWPAKGSPDMLVRETMINCTPRGICSWSYFLEGDGHSGEIVLGAWGEQGSLMADGQPFEICKSGWLSGEWNLLENGQLLALAQKTSAFRRRFELKAPAGPAVLEAGSAFSRGMELNGTGVNCRILPVHPFTRRATIDGGFEDFRMVAFAFWLTVLMWRRAANNNS